MMAMREASSIAQTCDIFLKLGVESYEEEGSEIPPALSLPPEERALRIVPAQAESRPIHRLR